MTTRTARKKPNKAGYVKVKKDPTLDTIGGVKVNTFSTRTVTSLRIESSKTIGDDLQGTNFYNAYDDTIYLHVQDVDIEYEVEVTTKKTKRVRPNASGYIKLKDDGYESINGALVSNLPRVSQQIKQTTDNSIGEYQGTNFYNTDDDCYYFKAPSAADVSVVYQLGLKERLLSPNKCGYCRITNTATYKHEQIKKINGAPFVASIYPYILDHITCKKDKQYGTYGVGLNQGKSFSSMGIYYIYAPAGIKVEYEV